MNTRKTKSIVTITAMLAIMMTGCSNDEKGDPMKLEEKTNNLVSEAKETSKEVADMTKDAWNSFSEYTVDKKDQASAFFDKQVASLDDEIDGLKQSASNASKTTKEKTAQAIETLEEKRRDLALQAKKMRNATSETWDEVKSETQEKWNDFTAFLQQTKNNLTSS